MKDNDIRTFMALAGQPVTDSLDIGDQARRKLGAQLLLSEVLEYIVDGLGVTPTWQGHEINSPDDLEYKISNQDPKPLEMVDGLADTAYTMYWNSLAFGIPLEEAFERVCKNNLDKFVKLETSEFSIGILDNSKWDCAQNISWPESVVLVEVVEVNACLFAVGRDANGKVRKPSSYQAVNLADLAA